MKDFLPESFRESNLQVNVSESGSRGTSFLDEQTCIFAGEVAAWLNVSVVGRFFSCIAERARDMVGQLLGIRKRK